jgi:transmembrane sensor
MNNIYQIPDQDQRYDEASQWLAKLDKSLCYEEEKELRLWLEVSPENRKVFLEMARLWDRMDSLSRLSELFPQVAEQEPAKQWFSPAMAASLLLASVVGLWVVTQLNMQTSPETERSPVAISNVVEGVYETAVGEHSNVQLPDGTSLVLNTNSLIQVNYTDRQRFIILKRGEVHIDVAHDESRPLIVQAGEQLVQAVGTSFSIELRSDQEIELVVTEGKVLVGVRPDSNQEVQELQPAVLPPSSMTVSEGEQLITGPSMDEIEKIEPAEIEVKLSWREGNLIFRGESLEDAVAEISRYTSVEFIFLDENLKKIRVAGLFKAGDVTGLLATLRQNFNITYERQEDRVILGRQ